VSKKILVCAYFAKNVGDDLFLKVLFERYPDVEWDLLTANRNYNKIFSDYKNVKIIYLYREVNFWKIRYNIFFKLNDLFLKYKKYDALINIGGSIFMQGPAWKMKFNEREYLVNRFKEMNKKIYILGANFGPYKEDQFLDKYKNLFTKYDDICFRDYYSYKIFKNLDNVRVAPDVVFNLITKTNTIKEKSIGISVINLENRDGLKEYYKQYHEKIINLCEGFIEQSYKVKLFSFCDNEGDLRAINSIVENVNSKYKDYIQVLNYEGNLDEFLKGFKSCETIIGTRFHSIILAMIYNQNYFPIIYSEKTLNVLRDLGLEQLGCNITNMENLSVEIIKKTVNSTKRNKNVLREANKQFEKLDQFLA
jgi:colanic acid/amylovoran biosynthesis protein